MVLHHLKRVINLKRIGAGIGFELVEVAVLQVLVGGV